MTRVPPKNPEAVAAIVSALRHVHGDDIARLLLSDGVSLAVIIDAVLSLPIANHNAARIIAKAIESGDFILTPDLGSLLHVRYLYDRPGAITVVDMVVLTPDRTFASNEISLRLPSSD